MTVLSSPRPLLSALALALATSALLAPPALAEPTWVDAVPLSVDMDGTDVDVVTAPDGTAVVGWVETIDDIDRAVVRERTLGGQWTPPRALSAATGDAEHLRLGVDDSGELTAVWGFRHADSGARSVRVRQRPAGGVWSPALTLTKTTSSSIDYDNPDVAVSPGGRAVVAWEVENGVSAIPRVAILQQGKGWQTLSPDIQRTGSLADVQAVPDDTGRTSVVWALDSGGARTIKSVIMGGDPGQAGIKTLSSASVAASRPSLAVNAAGRAVVSWTQQVDAGTIRVAAMTRAADAPFPTTPTVLTDAATSASRDTTTGVSASGEATVVYERQDVLLSRSNNGSGWQPAITAAEAGPGALEGAALDVEGTRSVLVWSQLDGDDRRIRAASRISGQWGTPDLVSASGREGRDPVVATSSNGDAVVAWRDNEPARAIGAAGLDGSGPVSKVNALPVIRLKDTVTAKWSARDRWSEVVNHRVQRRISAWNGGPGSFANWLSSSSSSSATPSTSPGRTLCVRARATDIYGNVGAFSGKRCSTTPVDDRTAVVKSGAWSAGTGSAYYRGTYRQATANGARLEWPGARGKSFALVAATGPGHGTVAVYLDNTLIRQVSLSSSQARTKVVLPLRTLTKVRAGALQVRVVSSGKPVRIDGIAVRR